MDEEDGRPGSQTRKFVAFDVHTDAFTRSLRQTCSISEQQNVFPLTRVTLLSTYSHRSPTTTTQINSRAFSGADLPKASAPPQVEEKRHENVPGK